MQRVYAIFFILWNFDCWPKGQCDLKKGYPRLRGETSVINLRKWRLSLWNEKDGKNKSMLTWLSENKNLNACDSTKWFHIYSHLILIAKYVLSILTFADEQAKSQSNYFFWNQAVSGMALSKIWSGLCDSIPHVLSGAWCCPWEAVLWWGQRPQQDRGSTSHGVWEDEEVKGDGIPSLEDIHQMLKGGPEPAQNIGQPSLNDWGIFLEPAAWVFPS